VPKGFAHGFVVLSETAIFAYKCDNYYAPDYDAGIMWNDEKVNIDWKVNNQDIILSDKDIAHSSLSNTNCFDYDKYQQEVLYHK